MGIHKQYHRRLSDSGYSVRYSKMGKKKRLMDIGRPRHEEFDAQLRRRFKGQASIEPKVNEMRNKA